MIGVLSFTVYIILLSILYAAVAEPTASPVAMRGHNTSNKPLVGTTLLVIIIVGVAFACLIAILLIYLWRKILFQGRRGLKTRKESTRVDLIDLEKQDQGKSSNQYADETLKETARVTIYDSYTPPSPVDETNLSELTKQINTAVDQIIGTDELGINILAEPGPFSSKNFLRWESVSFEPSLSIIGKG
jgi:hypothetical protein